MRTHCSTSGAANCSSVAPRRSLSCWYVGQSAPAADKQSQVQYTNTTEVSRRIDLIVIIGSWVNAGDSLFSIWFSAVRYEKRITFLAGSRKPTLFPDHVTSSCNATHIVAKVQRVSGYHDHFQGYRVRAACVNSFCHPSASIVSAPVATRNGPHPPVAIPTASAPTAPDCRLPQPGKPTGSFAGF